ncbi:APC family permease [Metallosphaera javensis (ex Sakai et al. 2022)]|uniref:APC family permease n=1 Tax=Metallosphaera javensis (ex Sakai et al. 2022) TaxID=2775498 RepID=UPI0025901843|nr:MAG: amino acid transporter [Metallosphaera javensis (ex Sakai et al. 2022)]
MEKISVAYATAVSLGAIIGSGIFVLSGTVISLAGILSILAFAFVGFLALIIAFETGELTSLFPDLKGSAYSFANEAFGTHLGFVTGVLLYFSYASSIAAISTGFGSYLSSIVGGDPIIYAILLILILSVLNLMGVQKAAEADFYLVMIKVAILVIFSAFALLLVNRVNLASHFTIPADAGYGFLESFQGIIFAYSGFQSVSTIASSVKGGGKGAARAIIYSVIISLVLYVTVVISMMILVPANLYRISADPLSFALSYVHAPQWLYLVVGIGALIATTSATLAMILTSSRMIYQLGADGLLPGIVAKYNRERDVASNGVIISAIIGLVTLFAGNVYVIAAISNFGLLFSYLVTSLAVIHLRKRTNPEFKTPGYPYLPWFSVVGLLVIFVGMPKEALLIGALSTMVLLVIYSLMREGKREKPEKVRLFDVLLSWKERRDQGMKQGS